MKRISIKKRKILRKRNLQKKQTKRNQNHLEKNVKIEKTVPRLPHQGGTKEDLDVTGTEGIEIGGAHADAPVHIHGIAVSQQREAAEKIEIVVVGKRMTKKTQNQSL